MGTIELFLGPMFAGKTTALIKRISELESQGKKVGVFKPKMDQRYAKSSICTHNKEAVKAENITLPKEAAAEKFDVIVIDEYHLFDSELIDCCKKWKNDGKQVILAGLDTDYLGNTMMLKDKKKSLDDIRKISDSISMLKSKCAICGKDATMTERTAKSEIYALVGGAESYRPVCKEHHPKWKK